MLNSLYNIIKRVTFSYRYHFICWAIFIAYEVLVTGILSGHFSPLINYVIFYIINIFTFYFQSEFILPKSETQGKRSISILVALQILNIVLYCSLFMLATTFVRFENAASRPNEHFNEKYFVGILWRGIYFMLYGSAFYLFKNYLKKRERLTLEAMEVERLNNLVLTTKQAYLRAQINPHLLFNTLNFIRYSAKRNPEEADEAIMCLSNIINFSLGHEQENVLPLKKEIEQINTLVRINQLRFANRLAVRQEYSIHDETIMIIPIVLLTLVENIFKHGDLSDDDHPAEITLITNENGIEFSTKNIISGRRIEHSGQQGLKNINERLALHYKNKAKFSYGAEGQVFYTKLHISNF